MIKDIALVCSGALAGHVPRYLYRIYQYYLEKRTLRNNIIANTIESRMYDIMFFTKESSLCRNHLYNDTISCERQYCPVKYLRRIKDYLDSATDTLYVCVFIITCPYLREAIIAANIRGVNVKIITDSGALTNTSTKVALYVSEGIEVRYLQQDSEETLMHHKFVVVDCRILITGSTNWTMSAFFGNYENLIVTDNPDFIVKYTREFTKIWDELLGSHDDRFFKEPCLFISGEMHFGQMRPYVPRTKYKGQNTKYQKDIQKILNILDRDLNNIYLNLNSFIK